MQNKTTDYLLNQKVKILQPKTGYRAAIDAVFLAASVQKVKKTDHILDVGAGTGAVSLCLAHHYPQNKITGWEIQPDLLNLAKESALLNGFQNVSYLEKDIKTAPRAANKVLYDHIVTNPPYFENNPKRHADNPSRVILSFGASASFAKDPGKTNQIVMLNAQTSC